MLFCSPSVVSSSFCSSPSNALCTLVRGTLQLPALRRISLQAKPRNCDKWPADWRLRLQRKLISITKQVYLLYLILKHEEVPWLVKVAGGCALGYVFSPIQLIPNFIPIIGQSDDLLVLYIGMKVVHRFTPPATLKQCEACVDSVSTAQIAKLQYRKDHRSGKSPRREANEAHILQ